MFEKKKLRDIPCIIVFDTQGGADGALPTAAYPAALVNTDVFGEVLRQCLRSLSTETIIEDEREPRRAKWRNQSRAAGTWRTGGDQTEDRTPGRYGPGGRTERAGRARARKRERAGKKKGGSAQR